MPDLFLPRRNPKATLPMQILIEEQFGMVQMFAIQDGHKLGHVYALITHGRLEITDLIVYEKAGRSSSLFDRIWSGFCLKPEASNRRKGIGTGLLSEILKYADRHQCSEVNGRIIPTDLKSSPFLLNWYSKYQFVVSEKRSDGVI